jgi:HNH endonuclease
MHDQGRTSRHPSQALRDLLGAVDGERCRYPSCTRRRKLHAHHLIAWLKGGRTDLANLILLCARHHETVIHGEGVRLQLDPVTRALTVTTAEGTPVPHRHNPPWQPAQDLDPNGSIDTNTLPPDGVDKLHLHYAVEILMQQAA